MADARLSEAPSAEDAAQLASLVQGRAKRSTAGRHMSALLNAEADDDLALLFEEVEDDNDFYDADAGDGGDDDDILDSSDDDDQGPAAQDDDFEGERELQKETKAENRKRKKQPVFNLQTLRKKVKIDPVAVPSPGSGPGPGPEEEPAPRPKKKSERISWIPTVEDGPTRSSSRRQTMHNKELTHERLKHSEVKRVKLIATMEEAAKKKAHLKPKEMTQAERLAEAERVERHNSKSLNRWEETEKRKAEERQAKIEALQNRRLEGPVMSYWSGLATWVDGRLTRVGKVDITQKPKEENKKKSKKPDKEDKPAQVAAAEVPAPAPVPDNAQGSGVPEDSKPVDPQNAQPDQAAENPTPPVPAGEVTKDPTQPPTEITNDAPGETVTGPTDDVPKEPTEKTTADEEPRGDTMDIDEKRQEAPKETAIVDEKLPEPPKDAMDVDEKKPQEGPKEPGPETEKAPQPTEEAAKAEKVQQPEIKADTPATAPTPEIGNSSTAATAAPGPQPDKVPTPTSQEQLAPEIHTDQPVTADEDGAAAAAGIPPPPPPPATVEETGRTLTILENFDDKTAHNREFSIYFNAKKPPRLTSMWHHLLHISLVDN